jgi:hypothetical protein
MGKRRGEDPRENASCAASVIQLAAQLAEELAIQETLPLSLRPPLTTSWRAELGQVAAGPLRKKLLKKKIALSLARVVTLPRNGSTEYVYSIVF